MNSERLAEILRRAKVAGARLRVTVGRAGTLAPARPDFPAVRLPPPPRFRLGQFVPVVRRVG